MFYTLFFLLLTAVASANVETIQIRWNSEICKQDCINILKKYMEKVRGIKKAEYSVSGGQVEIEWDQQVPFDYRALRTAMQMTGIGIRNIILKATGKIEERGELFFLTSTEAEFQLLSPLTPEAGMYVPGGTQETHELSDSERTQLSHFAQTKEEITVSGRLFFPDRGKPYKLVMADLVEKEPK